MTAIYGFCGTEAGRVWISWDGGWHDLGFERRRLVGWGLGLTQQRPARFGSRATEAGGVWVSHDRGR
ncbi:hypothetical protein L484_009211 [Morus notabilis]|uniref:Uncharacterized protein n=1 Tax=Morus notabilis TaxID=981085 RepID=W9SGI9_9ROSA|nr:hypothetical protein L484_009211 [Morus notabilis]